MSDNNLVRVGPNESTSLRILIVENDPMWRKVHSDLVSEWGYTPIIAEPPADCSDLEQGLLDDAKNKVTKHWCHIAIVDKCLKHDGDADDKSGLELIPLLAPAASIIVSGYADAPDWREAASLGVQAFRKSELDFGSDIIC